MTDEWTIHEDARERGKMCQMLSGRIAELEAENARLREALGEAQMGERARCLNIIASYVMRTRVKPHGAVGQALDFIIHEMKGTTDE